MEHKVPPIFHTSERTEQEKKCQTFKEHSLYIVILHSKCVPTFLHAATALFDIRTSAAAFPLEILLLVEKKPEC